ncbi:MAG: hypothetical protein ACTHMU_08315 [Thermomicrobiales bacterium]
MAGTAKLSRRRALSALTTQPPAYGPPALRRGTIKRADLYKMHT